MIADIGTGERDAFAQDFDVCVIGSGPAGITLPRRLAGQGAHVALMEAGGLEISLDSQAVYEGEIVGQEYFPLDVTRLRYFGGSSNHWAGWCREFSAEDMQPRPGDPWGGWPIAKAVLDPYQPDADAILDLPPAADYAEYDIAQAAPNYRGFRMRHSSPTTRFGQKFRDDIVASERILLGLHANLVDLRFDAAGEGVETAVFRSYEPGSPDLAVSARFFALCLGGLENPRALLNARGQRPTGLDTLVLYKEVIRAMPCAADFTERLAERVLGRALYCKGRGIGGYLEQRRERAEILADPRTELLIRSEQALSPESRVRLAESRDRFGLPRIALDWRLSEIDYATMQVAATSFGAHLAEQEIGRLRVADWLLGDPPQVPQIPDEETGGHHHLCTTRMSDNPRRGVLDGDCRVHSVRNLYVGGSSTFATAGWVNPTYTIVQLALRLGDHLGQEIRKA